MGENINNTGSGLGIVLGIVGLVWLANILSKKKCSHCGYDNPPDAQMCSFCGSWLK